LFSLKVFLLNLSSICHVAGLARLSSRAGAASAQSYPQLLWVSSYVRERFSYSGRVHDNRPLPPPTNRF
jgi:hypothetical protein